MRCPKCGSYVNENTRYCAHCGTDVSRAARPLGATVNHATHDTYGNPLPASPYAGVPNGGSGAHGGEPAGGGSVSGNGFVRKSPRKRLLVGCLVIFIAFFVAVVAIVGISAFNTTGSSDRDSGSDKNLSYAGDGFTIEYYNDEWKARGYMGQDAFFYVPDYSGATVYEHSYLTVEAVISDSGYEMTFADERAAAFEEYMAKYGEQLLSDGYMPDLSMGAEGFGEVVPEALMFVSTAPRESDYLHNSVFVASLDFFSDGEIAGTLYLVANGHGREIIVFRLTAEDEWAFSELWYPVRALFTYLTFSEQSAPPIPDFDPDAYVNAFAEALQSNDLISNKLDPIPEVPYGLAVYRFGDAGRLTVNPDSPSVQIVFLRNAADPIETANLTAAALTAAGLHGERLSRAIEHLYTAAALSGEPQTILSARQIFTFTYTEEGSILTIRPEY
ncbi:MAG: zinc ribbon domain-containing protein [Clostridiales Family XIII bacterium]|jgi:hypothetical protein|nr:zinc ribbon domain-containing protein [Clostridiales Family XIII bacterium]